MAYNTITGIARAVSTSFPIRMRLTGGAVWADGILQNDGTYLCTLVAVPAGSYPAGAVEYELKGSNPVVRAYNTNATIVTNDPSAGGGTPATKANKPQFGVLDDVGNTVIITSEYAYDQIYWGIDGQGTPAQQLASNYTCSPGNITGRLYAYVMGNAAANRLQSDYSYSSSFSAAANANTNPIATLSVVGGVSSVTTGQSIVLQLDGVDSDQGDSVVKMEALDNGVKIGEITGASGALQTPPLGAGSHSFTARAVDSKGAAGLSPAKLVTATSSGSVWDNKPLLYNAGGDSKADGTYVAKIATALGAAPTYTNGAHFETTNYQCWWTARGGNIIEEQINNFASMAAPLLTGTFTGGVYSIECGVNNLLRRTGQSAAQLADQLKTLVGMARDAGYKVIIETLTRTTWGDQNGSDPNANGTGVLGTY
jgi:predicted Rdx family selenoprotein